MTQTPSPDFRVARSGDLLRLVELLRDDPLGAGRESGYGDAKAQYEKAFRAIDTDPHNMIIVAEIDGEICGCLQLTYIPGLTYQGGERAQIEGVRVATGRRGGGLGRMMLDHAIDLAAKRGCVLVQLTSDRSRGRALAFYRSAGFDDSHCGMKLRLR